MTATQSFPSLSSDELDMLAQLIEHEKCILVLGPLASAAKQPDESWRSLHSLLVQQLADVMHPRTDHLLAEPDSLALVSTAFMQRPGTAHISLEIRVRDFYQPYMNKPDEAPSPILQEVAQLPFRLILSAAPDNLLEQAFA
ncbi:MAG: hypothetical protein ABIQ93_11850, partial [Saprospiraceae bacterium]